MKRGLVKRVLMGVKGGAIGFVKNVRGTRTFDGKTYRYVGSFVDKKEVQRKVERFRESGLSARTVHVPSITVMGKAVLTSQGIQTHDWQTKESWDVYVYPYKKFWSA